MASGKKNTWYGKVFFEIICLFKSQLLASGSAVDEITQRGRVKKGPLSLLRDAKTYTERTERLL